MTIINKTRNTTLAAKLLIPSSLLDQTLGLLKYKTPQAMLLRTHFGIHTFGMRYPIDVLILDNEHHVVAMKEHLKPNRIFLWKITYDIILELPTGTIKKTQTEIGDTLLY